MDEERREIVDVDAQLPVNELDELVLRDVGALGVILPRLRGSGVFARGALVAAVADDNAALLNDFGQRLQAEAV